MKNNCGVKGCICRTVPIEDSTVIKNATPGGSGGGYTGGGGAGHNSGKPMEIINKDTELSVLLRIERLLERKK